MSKNAEFKQKINAIVKQASGWELMQNAANMGPEGMGAALSAIKGGLGNAYNVATGGGALAFLNAILKHRLLDAGVSSALRNTELLKPYYANMSREGIQAALSGQDLMPKYRQGIGTAAFNPSVSGLGDYEISKELARRLIDEHEKETGVRMTTLDEIRSNPRVKAIMERAHPGVLKSELSQNFIRALDEKLEPNPVVERLKKPDRFGIGGIGPDQQRYGGRIGLAGATLLGTGMGAYAGDALHGAVTNTAVQAPEYLASAALGKPHSTWAQKLLDFGIGLKKSVLGQGKLDALRRMRGAADSTQIGSLELTPENKEALKSIGYHGLNQLSGELYNLGRDAGTIGAMYRDADPVSAAAAGLPPAAVRKEQVDTAGDYVHRNWESPKPRVPENLPRDQSFMARLKRMIGLNNSMLDSQQVHPAALPSTDRGLLSHVSPDLRSYMDKPVAKQNFTKLAPRADADRWHGFDLSAVSPHTMDSPSAFLGKNKARPRLVSRTYRLK